MSVHPRGVCLVLVVLALGFSSLAAYGYTYYEGYITWVEEYASYAGPFQQALGKWDNWKYHSLVMDDDITRAEILGYVPSAGGYGNPMLGGDDDFFFFQFSGHGGPYGIDDNGDELPKPADQSDEYFTDRQKLKDQKWRMIDDEFGDLFDQVMFPYQLASFDSCHSGGILGGKNDLRGENHPYQKNIDLAVAWSGDEDLPAWAQQEVVWPKKANADKGSKTVVTVDEWLKHHKEVKADPRNNPDYKGGSTWLGTGIPMLYDNTVDVTCKKAPDPQAAGVFDYTYTVKNHSWQDHIDEWTLWVNEKYYDVTTITDPYPGMEYWVHHAYDDRIEWYLNPDLGVDYADLVWGTGVQPKEGTLTFSFKSKYPAQKRKYWTQFTGALTDTYPKWYIPMGNEIGGVEAPTPEPCSGLLLLLGAPVACWARRRGKK